MSSGKFSETIRNSNADAEVLGLVGTPAFFIIGHDKSVTRITGAQPYEVFEKIFDKELEKLQ